MSFSQVQTTSKAVFISISLMRGEALRLIVIGQRSNLEEYGSILSVSEDTYHETIGLPLIVRIEVVTT